MEALTAESAEGMEVVGARKGGGCECDTGTRCWHYPGRSKRLANRRVQYLCEIRQKSWMPQGDFGRENSGEIGLFRVSIGS